MALKVINRSKAVLDVLVTTVSGDRIIRLGPGKQNNGTVIPRAVRPASSFDRLMGKREWIEILTDIAVVYEWGRTGIGFNSSTSLHCVPFSPTGIGPYDPGYRTLTPEPIAPEHADPQPVENVPPADLRDGEFNMKDQPFFGKYVRTKLGTTTYITVRLNLRRLGITDAQLLNIKPTWKSEIETVWNNSPTSTAGQSLRFEVDWTDRVPHSSVFVRDSFEFFWEDGQRDSMFLWSLGMGTGNLTTKVAAHEFGHHLGLSDAYHYQGEIPGLAEQMVKTSALFASKAISPTFGTQLWSIVGASVTSSRAAERIQSGAFGTSRLPNLMMGVSRVGPKANSTHRTKFKNDPNRDGISAVTLIDQELIDAIDEQRLQSLYLDEVDYLKSQSYADPSYSYDGYFTT